MGHLTPGPIGLNIVLFFLLVLMESIPYSTCGPFLKAFTPRKSLEGEGEIFKEAWAVLLGIVAGLCGPLDFKKGVSRRGRSMDMKVR